MKAHLLFREQDFDIEEDLPPNAPELLLDLDLNILFENMACGDTFLYDIAKQVVLKGLTSMDAISYRQHILMDCLEHPATVREMYELVVQAIQDEKKSYRRIFNRYPDSILRGSVQVLELFIVVLKRLRNISYESEGIFRSEGFLQFFKMLKNELDDEYFSIVHEHLEQLKFEDGVKISARLGKGNRGTNLSLHRYSDERKGWFKRMFIKDNEAYSFEVDKRDISGLEALSELRNKGINSVANSVAQSADHILSFFTMLRIELGFYIGCLNLHERFASLGGPTSFPTPRTSKNTILSARDLYDASLSLRLERKAVGNDVSADNKTMIVVTGANQGGKTTFLRSIGQVHLMMQSGMFVCAEHFEANICEGVFTHFKRREDSSMNMGKLDEELSRMNDIVKQIKPRCLLLCNESFSSTNEKEGSEIARQILQAMVDEEIKVFYVTHLFDFAGGLYERKMENTLFLRAERNSGGDRTFKVTEGEPLATSYGKDLYDRLFATS
jgi:DNA mismatch repair ATPase MutS